MNTSDPTLAHRSVIRRAAQTVSSGSAVDESTAKDLISDCMVLLPELEARQHPLGFLHLDLSLVAGIPGTRLHVWNDNFQSRADPLGRLHDHSWELFSTVLVGALVDHELQSVQRAEGAYSAHRVIYGPQGNRLDRLTGRWDLVENSRKSVFPGQAYHLPPRVIHLTQVLQVPTATLVVAVERGGPGPTVYSPLTSLAEKAAERPAVSRGDCQHALSSVLSALCA